MREDYFKGRNLKEDLTLVPKAEELMKKQMRSFNIVEGTPKEDLKKKRAARRESEAQLPSLEAEKAKEAPGKADGNV